MHPIVIYEIHRLEHRQRLAELTHRRSIVRELRIRQIIAQLTRGGRSTGRLSAAMGTVAAPGTVAASTTVAQQKENTDFIRAS
ncbi:hypothetical protein IM660_06785 [Ruania alkalisoli]|uniref:Uncharacterized protein n=1 Tax=Ruania alkalisoli TaxID=2779775 RepID=A0A7M1SWI9_9MICO|nr:hypothetical protein [Ruania alkalisoli]QOR71950.1 hypothetical protein IM660_06785 [Ruania alkalisoli]